MSETTTKRLDTGSSLQAYLGDLFETGVKSALSQRALTEKEKQVATAGAGAPSGGDENDVDDLFGAGGGGDDEGSHTSKTMDDEQEKLQSGDIKAKDIIEKLNSIRSGKSFKDSAVSKAIDDYINSLSKPEKVALMAFAKGIAQIVTGEIPAQNAEDPHQHPSDVKMDKTNEPHVVHKRPNVIQGAGNSGGGQAPVKRKGPPEEDTTPPHAPITPKRRV